jgi:hypothetical protein
MAKAGSEAPSLIDLNSCAENSGHLRTRIADLLIHRPIQNHNPLQNSGMTCFDEDLSIMAQHSTDSGNSRDLLGTSVQFEER